jgi:UDPglucose--hexose-1-phosphate uridylyltransferase
VPSEVACEIAAAERLYEQHGDCFFCRVLADERQHGQRLVAESEHFVVVCPYASRFPYEMWLLPRNHASHFESQPDEQLRDLSGILQSVIGRLEALHERLAYNYFIHTAPLDAPGLGHYHWHLEILPRLTTTAGFEWGAGYYINPMLPEHAAALLRAQEAPGCRAKTASFPTGKASQAG